MAEEIEERTADADSPAADGRPEDTEQRERVVKNTGLMTVGTLASRATGLLRTWAMAYALGNTLLTSSYQVANNLPNVLYELVAGGFLSAAFLPVLLLQKERFGREGENRYTSNILNITLIALGALSILSCIFADAVVSTQTFTVGDTAEVHQRTVEFFRVFAFQIVFYGLGGVLTGVLNAHRSFFLTSIAPALNNLVTIAGFVAFAIIPQQEAGIVVLAVATTAGVAVQFVIQIPALVKSGFRWQPYVKLRDPAIRETMKIALPSVIYIAANLVAYTFRNAFSLNATETGPSALAYAWMWFQLPYGVVAVSLSSTMFTEMSDDVAKGDMGAFRKHVYRGLSGTLFLIIPLTGLLCVLSEPIFQLFHAGAFNGADVTQVASLLAVWVLCLPIYSVGMYLYKAVRAVELRNRSGAARALRHTVPPRRLRNLRRADSGLRVLHPPRRGEHSPVAPLCGEGRCGAGVEDRPADAAVDAGGHGTGLGAAERRSRDAGPSRRHVGPHRPGGNRAARMRHRGSGRDFRLGEGAESR